MSNLDRKFTELIMPSLVEESFKARDQSPDDYFRISDEKRSEYQRNYGLEVGQVAALCYLAEKQAEDSLFNLEIELISNGIRP